MPCVQAFDREEREEYIRQYRRDVDEFRGVTDAVEVLKIVHKPRAFDPLVNWLPYHTPTDRVYAELSAVDQQHMDEYGASLVGTERQDDEAEEIALCLAAFTECSLDHIQRALVDNNTIYPSLPFHRASSEIRDELVKRVDEDDANRNHILLALAWIGDAVVVDLFERWRREPPFWAAGLYIPPQDYSREAGWELTEDGRKRQLYFDACRKLEKGSSRSPEVFQAIIAREELCPWCSQRLTDILTVAPAALGFPDRDVWSGRVQVTACEVCSCFTTVFGSMGQSGKGEWSSSNSRPIHLPPDPASWARLPQDPLSLGPWRRPLFASDQFLPTTFSQLGGHPTWIQDAEYPTCPDCQRTMMFLAQIDIEDVDNSSEGIYYAFLCLTCRVTATSFQMT